jgi:hypothetical protein
VEGYECFAIQGFEDAGRVGQRLAAQMRLPVSIGSLTPPGEPTLGIARLWAELTPHLEPGGRSSVRLAPIDPSQWQHLRVGQVITKREDRQFLGVRFVHCAAHHIAGRVVSRPVFG